MARANRHFLSGYVKEFSLGKLHRWKEPQKHGEFDEIGERYQFRFWYPDFYEPKQNQE